MRSHARRSEDLTGLREHLLAMGGRVEVMIARSIRALESANGDLARQTIVLDRWVNQDEIDIDATCARLMLGGLDESEVRLVQAASKMVTDLERIGDLSVNVCELVLALEETGVPGDIPEIRRIADLVLDMLRRAMIAFRENDAATAQAVVEADDAVDEACRTLFLDVLGRLVRGGGHPELCVPEQTIARSLERTADHVTNVAEQVIFVVRGRDVRHAGKRP